MAESTTRAILDGLIACTTLAESTEPATVWYTPGILNDGIPAYRTEIAKTFLKLNADKYRTDGGFSLDVGCGVG